MKNISYFLMVGLYKKFILCLCLSLLWANNSHSFKLKRMMGGKGKNPGGEIIKFLTAFPGLFESFGSALVKTKATIQIARMSLQMPIPQPELLLKSYMLIGIEVYKLHVQSINFRMMPPVLMFKTFAFQCGSPVLTAAMGIPVAGQVVVGLCSRLSALEVKFDVLISRIENTISEGMMIRETIQNRLLQIPNGQEMLAKIPMVVLPPLPPELTQPPQGIPGLVIPSLPSIPKPEMIMQNVQGQMMAAGQAQMAGQMEGMKNTDSENGDVSNNPIQQLQQQAVASQNKQSAKKASKAKKEKSRDDTDSGEDDDDGGGGDDDGE